MLICRNSEVIFGTVLELSQKASLSCSEGSLRVCVLLGNQPWFFVKRVESQRDVVFSGAMLHPLECDAGRCHCGLEPLRTLQTPHPTMLNSTDDSISEISMLGGGGSGGGKGGGFCQ